MDARASDASAVDASRQVDASALHAMEVPRGDAPVAGCEAAEESAADGGSTSVDVRAATRGARWINSLALSMHQHLSREHRNVVFSPVGVAFALALLAGGARGATQAQIVRALHAPGAADLPPAFGALRARLESMPGAEKHGASAVRVGVSLWIDDSAPVRPPFLDFARERYASLVQNVDFKTETETARDRVNHWGACETNGRIPEILSPDSCDSSTRVVVVSSTYFGDRWASVFKLGDAHDFDTGETQVSVPFMWLNHDVPYAQVAGAELLQLPYVSGLAMLIVLPARGTTLDAIEARLPGEYERWLRGLAQRTAHVELPRWTTASRLPLERELRAQGIRAAFDHGAADFSGISTQSIYLRSAVHDAVIAVDETGTDAASLTGMGGGFMSARPEEPVFFRADRPFLYFLRDRVTGVIAFAGIVTNPML